MRYRIEARELMHGDIVTGSGRKVKSIVRHPPGNPGKVAIQFENEKRPRLWGRYTKVQIARTIHAL